MYIRIYILYILATHCNTLQHTATHCNTLQHKYDVHKDIYPIYLGNTLQHTATHCNTNMMYIKIYILYILATHCNTLQHTATHCNTLQHKYDVHKDIYPIYLGDTRQSVYMMYTYIHMCIYDVYIYT